MPLPFHPCLYRWVAGSNLVVVMAKGGRTRQSDIMQEEVLVRI